MARTKSFTGKVRDSMEPAEFLLGDKTFRLVHALPARAMAVVTEELWGAAKLIDFIEKCIVEEDVPAFQAAINDKNFIIDYETIIEIANWIIECLTKRPLAQPVFSTASGPTTPGSSTGASGFEDLALENSKLT